MAKKRKPSGSMSDPGAARRGRNKKETRLKDLDAKSGQKVRGGALQAYLYMPGQKQGANKGQ